MAASLLDQINDFTAISADVSTKLHERFEAYMRGGNEFALCSQVYCKIAPDQTNPVLIELARKAGKPQKVPERIVHGLAADVAKKPPKFCIAVCRLSRTSNTRLPRRSLNLAMNWKSSKCCVAEGFRISASWNHAEPSVISERAIAFR